MKRYIKYFTTLSLLASIIVSCSSDDTTDYTAVGGNVIASESITRLDTNYDFPLKIFTKEGVSVTKIEIFKNSAASSSQPIKLGNKLTDATISGDKATFNTSTLGSFNAFPHTVDDEIVMTGTTGSISLAIVTTYSDGSTTLAPYVLNVEKGIVWKGLDEKNEPKKTQTESGIITIEYGNPTPAIIYYEVLSKSSTTIDSVVGEYGINGSNEYKPLPGTFGKKGSLDIAGIQYHNYDGGLHINDKVTYRFTATAGTQTDVITTTVQFVAQNFDSEHTAAIGTQEEELHYNFNTNSNPATQIAAEIVFKKDFGILVNITNFDFGITTLNYEEAQLLDVIGAYQSAQKITTISNLTANDVLVYKALREKNGVIGTYYGIIKIDDTILTSTYQKIQFSYKEKQFKVMVN